MRSKVELAEAWKESDLSWRASMRHEELPARTKADKKDETRQRSP